MIENFKPQGFINQHTLCEDPRREDFIFSFQENNLLLLETGELPRWQDINSLIINEKSELYCFGELNQTRCLLVRDLFEKTRTHEGFHLRNIRACHETLSEPLFRLAGLARQLQYWRNTHVHCGHCGARTIDKNDERAKICPQCRTISYPQLYPCIIVLVTRGSELLLARSPHFPPGVYSTLAGFIEPGESAENAVFREIREEAGIAVKNIRYQLSQPWPFPNSLMLGFLAEYESGEIAIDRAELEDAQWFSRDRLPPLPSSLSISRFLIENYLK